MTLQIVYHDTPNPIRYTSSSDTDWKFVWHTTEVNGMPGYNGGAIAPQLTAQLREYGSRTKIKRVLHQHYNFINYAGKALKHTSGSGETNTDHAVQCEIIATCDPNSSSGALFVADFTDDDYAFLAEVNDYVTGYVPIARKQLGQMKSFDASYGSSNGVRFSVSFWDKSSGHCGHQNVPGNVHGDPGNLNIQKILQGADMPLSDADVEKIWNRVGTTSDSMNPNPDGTPVVRTAQMDTFVMETFKRVFNTQTAANKTLALLNDPTALAQAIVDAWPNNAENGATPAQVETIVRSVLGPLADLRAPGPLST